MYTVGEPVDRNSVNLPVIDGQGEWAIAEISEPSKTRKKEITEE